MPDTAYPWRCWRRRCSCRLPPRPAARDSDRDGLADDYESAVSHTLPRSPDTDEDRIDDGLEVAYGSDPLTWPRTNGSLIELLRAVASPAVARFAPPETDTAAAEAEVFVAPDGSDDADCTRAEPCRSMQRAYADAENGGVVRMGPGWYETQTLVEDEKPVTFKGGPGVRLRQLISDASNVTFDGVEVDAGGVRPNMAAVELRGSGATFKNAAVGNVVDEKGMLITGANHTIENVRFHDAVLETPGIHMECAYAIGAPGLTVRDSTFRDCAVMDLFITYGDWWKPQAPAYGNVTLENNVFSHPEAENNNGWHTCCGLYVGSLGPEGPGQPMLGWTVRNNTFEQTALVTPERGEGTRWVGNVGDWECRPGVRYSHNVGSACSDTDTPVSPASSSPETGPAPFGWVNPEAHDFRLEAGSPAVDAGDPDDAPATDRNGSRRDRSPDAGAYEAR